MPETSGIDSFLGLLLIVATVLFVIWIVLILFSWWQRRAYSLSIAETSQSAGLKPDFLKVNKAARDAAMARGAAFDARTQGPAPTPVTKAASYSGLVALVAAILSFVTASFAALQKVQVFQSAVDQLSSWDRFAAILSRYSAGFAIAALIIVLQVLHLAYRFFKSNNA